MGVTQPTTRPPEGLVEFPEDGRMSMRDRLELEAEGRTAVLALTRWQRWVSVLAWSWIAAAGLLDLAGLVGHGPVRILVGVLLVVALAVEFVISFAPPPLGARVVRIRELDPDLKDQVSSAVSIAVRRVSRWRRSQP